MPERASSYHANEGTVRCDLARQRWGGTPNGRVRPKAKPVSF